MKVEHESIAVLMETIKGMEAQASVYSTGLEGASEHLRKYTKELGLFNRMKGWTEDLEDLAIIDKHISETQWNVDKYTQDQDNFSSALAQVNTVVEDFKTIIKSLESEPF